MERNIVLYIAMSLDGYIADNNGGVGWLESLGMSEEAAKSYEEFLDTIDTVIMGSKTYLQLIYELSPDNWPYEGKKCYVASRNNFLPDSHVTKVSEDILDFSQSLKNNPGKDIWLVGGANLANQFIAHNIIDKYIITVAPIILGGGIPLFEPKQIETQLTLIKTRSISGLAELTYVKRS